VISTASAIWRRLDAPGHDAALLTASDAGWRLRGAAVFARPAGPASIEYWLEIDREWRAKRGRICGFLGEKIIDYTISREADGWRLDGAPVAGLGHLVDLDCDFTPSTNLPQLRRANIRPGQAFELPAAWFDVETATLTELPQRYERRDETTYWYVAPTAGYEGSLEVSASGFIRNYPELWRSEE
jgi:hypothetical protein